MAEWISNCFSELQSIFSTFDQTAETVERVTAFVSSLWVDQNINNQTDEEEQNSPEVANAVLGAPSQRSGPPPRPNALLITEGKQVATWVTSISAGGILTVFGITGNKRHERIFMAFVLLSYVSLLSGLLLHYFIRKSPETRGLVKVVKFLIHFSRGTFVYAISCAVCLMFPSKIGVISILAVASIVLGLIAILSSARWGQGSIP